MNLNYFSCNGNHQAQIQPILHELVRISNFTQLDKRLDVFIKINGKKKCFNQDQYFPDSAEMWVCNSNILKCIISCGYNYKFQSTNEWINIYPSNHQQANTTVKGGCHWKVLNTSLCSFNYLSQLYIDRPLFSPTDHGNKLVGEDYHECIRQFLNWTK